MPEENDRLRGMLAAATAVRPAMRPLAFKRLDTLLQSLPTR
jgi:hypothetical protein